MIIRRVFLDEKRLKAVVSLVIDDNEFTIHDVKIIRTEERWFVAMPSEQILVSGSAHEVEFRDIAHPIGPENRAKLEKAVFLRYREYLFAKEWLHGEGQYADDLQEIEEELARLGAA